MPSPVHIRAKPEDISPLVVVAGDPTRTEQLASLLSDSRVVNTNRGFLTWTGHYRRKKVTVSTHGIGGPSAAIAFEELRMLGAEAIVRLGTCGGLVGELRRGDFIVPTAAAHPNGSLKAYVADGVLPPVPDRGLTAKLIDGCRLAGVRFREGLVFSSDAFYTEDRAHLKSWMSMGVIGVEMECATLFTLAALRGFKASSLVIVSDNLVRTGEKRMLPAAELKARVGIAGRIVLDGITSRTD